MNVFWMCWGQSSLRGCLNIMHKYTHVHGHCISKDILFTNKHQDVGDDNEMDDVV